MIIFMMEELVIKTFPSGNQLQKAAKRLTREMMLRNEAYSKLVQNIFSNHIRLSMHQSTNNGNKYSFKLINFPKANMSAWHSSIVISPNNEYETIHKKDAIERNYQLVFKDNRPYNFIQI